MRIETAVNASDFKMVLAGDDTEKLRGYQEKNCRRCREQGFIHWPSQADEMDPCRAAECCCQLSDSLVHPVTALAETNYPA